MYQWLGRYPFSVQCYRFPEQEKIMDELIHFVDLFQKVIEKLAELFFVFDLLSVYGFFYMTDGKG